MRRLLPIFAVLLLVGAVLALADKVAPKPEFDFRAEDKNPATALALNNAPGVFRFAVVSDRTGGHRAKVFSKAVEQLNLMQPEFVVSVGDLIEGYTTDKSRIDREWREFQGYVSKLQMPFFYVPGNHDVQNKTQLAIYREKFGRTYFSWTYKNVLFLGLDSEDPPGAKTKAAFSAEQIAWVKKTLADNPKVRWTLVFLHKPVWMMEQNDLAKTGFTEIEKALDGRKYTVFAGHVHRYQKFVRQGMNYYMLATTGGDSRMRGVEYGEFDHISWVTMTDKGPVMANVTLDGIVREDLSPILTDEAGSHEYYRRPTRPATLKVTYKGKPLAGATVVLDAITKETRAPRADGVSAADGSVKLSTYEAFDGVPAGEYAVSVTLRQPAFLPDGTTGKNTLPAKYASKAVTPLRVEVKTGEANAFTINLED